MANPTLDDHTLARRKPIGEALGSKDTLLPTMPTGIHNSTPPTMADGDVAPTQVDDMGNIKVSIGDPAQMSLLRNSDLQNYLSAIQNALQILTFLAGCRGIASDLRVTLLSGALTSCSTVTTVTQFGGNPAINVVPNLQNSLYNVSIMSNIGVV